MGISTMVLALLLPLTTLGEEEVVDDPEREEQELEEEEEEGSCEDGDMEKCYELGNEEYKSGSIDEAKDILGQACNDGYMKACSSLGSIIEKEGDMASASGLYKKACEGDFPRACESFNRLNPGMPQRLPASVDKGQENISPETLEKLVGSVEESCRELGRVRKMMNGEKSLAGLEASCRAGNPVDCYVAGMEYAADTNNSNEEKAIELFRLSLNSKIGLASDRLGSLLMAKGKTKEAMAVYAKGCGGGFGRNCTALGKLEEKKGKMKKAKGFFKQGCDGGDPEGCHGLAKLEEKGNNVVSARTLYRRACLLHDQRGCGNFLRLDKEHKKR